MIILTDDWHRTFPGASVGFLAMSNVSNPDRHDQLDQLKVQLESELRQQFASQPASAIADLPEMRAFTEYYRRYKKTYHVRLQLESLVYKGKSIPKTASLVEAMFTAELKGMLLTAGHDLDVLELPVTVNVSLGGERYTLMRGVEQELKPGDMFMADRQGIISSIIYGPDQRSQIRPQTRQVLFAVYAPAGILTTMIYDHLENIRQNVLVVSPTAATDLLEVYSA